MSSNIEVERICQFCGNAFVAKTTVTKFCSHRCSSLAYKQKKRESKIENSNYETLTQLNSAHDPILKGREFLTPRNAALLLGIGRATMYCYLADNVVKCVRIGGKTFIRRRDIDALFDAAGAYEPKVEEQPEPITEFYTIKEIMEKFQCGETWAYRVIKEKNIPRVSRFGRTLYSKRHVDRSFKAKSKPVTFEYYTTEEAIAKYDLTRDSLYHIIKKNNIPKIKAGRHIKIAAAELDKIFEKPIIL
ncbi:MAG: helix-turn-helix domain-containing protein [Culturomica sp.]|jgi:predicted DNA-binding transcriptional regulator AlpA/predicted nucleic acid-binding Zn ribbon protein|nr:helix-turn-helix domain-containing protein [Culturomica sp.]